MRILEKLKLHTYFLILMSTLSFHVHAQKLCSHNGHCIIFPDQLEKLKQKQYETKEKLPQANREFVLNQQQREQQRAQQLAQQQAKKQPVEQAQRKSQQQALLQTQQQVQNQTKKISQQLQNYNPSVATSVSLNILNLAKKLSQKLQSEKLDGQKIFSPISIFSVLQLLLTGANGETFNELNRLLSYRSNMGSSVSQDEFGKLIEDLVSDEINPKRLRPDAEWKFSSIHENDVINKPKPQKIRLANGVFIQKGISIRPSYRSIIENIYKSQVENLDFRQKDYVEQYINGWVNEKTYGKIPTIIDKGSFDPSTSMIMACAVYFKGFWKRPFISGATMVKDFYPDGTDNLSTSIKVNMMANGGYFPYYEDPNYKIKVIGFPYSKGTSTMYIFQPYNSTRERLQQMQKILTPEVIEYMISQMKKKNSVLIFPRLHIINSFDLRDVLKSLGLESIFFLNKSDLSLIMEPNSSYTNVKQSPTGYLRYTNSIRNSPDLIKSDLYVDSILHKIDLVINEEGTEGAAVTAVILNKSGPDVIFRAETPFLILLRHDTTKIPIFYGAIFEPTLN